MYSPRFRSLRKGLSPGAPGRTQRLKAADWSSNNPLLYDDETGVETDTGVVKIGDGKTRWNDLTPVGGSGGGGGGGSSNTITMTYDEYAAGYSTGTTYTPGTLALLSEVPPNNGVYVLIFNDDGITPTILYPPATPNIQTNSVMSDVGIYITAADTPSWRFDGPLTGWTEISGDGARSVWQITRLPATYTSGGAVDNPTDFGHARWSFLADDGVTLDGPRLYQFMFSANITSATDPVPDIDVQVTVNGRQYITLNPSQNVSNDPTGPFQGFISKHISELSWDSGYDITVMALGAPGAPPADLHMTCSLSVFDYTLSYSQTTVTIE